MPREVGTGSGFIIENGLILTNNHVVDIDGADYIVMLNNDTEYDAVVVNRDSINDVAILRIKSSINTLPSIRIGDSDTLNVGQNVLANGKSGVIKSTNFDIVTSTKTLSSLLQTDIPIESGDSGSPLLNSYCEVIGINVAFSEDSQDVGFAIPINKAKALLDEIKYLK